MSTFDFGRFFVVTKALYSISVSQNVSVQFVQVEDQKVPLVLNLEGRELPNWSNLCFSDTKNIKFFSSPRTLQTCFDKNMKIYNV